MARAIIAAALYALLGGASACADPDDGRLATAGGGEQGDARESRFLSVLRDTGHAPWEPIAKWMLPVSMREISGVTLIGDGLLLAHADERSVIWEIDYRRGLFVRQFTVGTPALLGDFEGITRIGTRFLLLESNGDIYEFEAGDNGEHVPFKRHSTGLGDACEFEGIAHDPALDILLLACKHITEKDAKDAVRIYRWRADGSGMAMPPISIPLEAFEQTRTWDEVLPSDITVDEKTGNYILVLASLHAVVELGREGEILRTRILPAEHEEAEGIAISPDRALIVADESGAARGATITVYQWR